MIQKVTVELARDVGFDAVTTEAISRRAGISARTFFNYYANKETALTGPEPAIPPEMRASFLSDDLPIDRLLHNLMRDHTLKAEGQKDVLKIVLSLKRTQPRVLQVYMARRDFICDQMIELLAERFPDRNAQFLNILAHTLLGACWSGITQWLEKDRPLEDCFEEAWAALSGVSCLILGEGRTQGRSGD